MRVQRLEPISRLVKQTFSLSCGVLSKNQRPLLLKIKEKNRQSKHGLISMLCLPTHRSTLLGSQAECPIQDIFHPKMPEPSFFTEAHYWVWTDSLGESRNDLP